MSQLYSILNAIVLAGIAIAVYFIFSQPREYAVPNDAWFRSAVLDQHEPVLVKFGAEWCGPCRMLEPQLDQLAAKGNKVVRVDVDQHQDLAQNYGISSIPRLLLFNHGKVVADRVGYADEQQLQSWVSANAN